MAVTDLTGTKWLINDNPDISDYTSTTGYDLVFTSNDIDFSLINFVVASRIGGIQYDTDFAYVDYDDTSAGLSEGWQNEAYRTIQITGGTGATNANLISWLQDNATQIEEQSNTFSFGNLPIANMYFGTRQVKKVYMGNTLVWEKEEEPQPTVDPILENNSWDVIKSVCEAGRATNYWSIGDTKTDVGTDGVTRTFRIADMQGLYGKHVVFEQVEQESTTYVWNPSSNTDDNSAYNNYSITNVSGSIRYALNTTIKALYSSALQAALTQTTVKVAKNGSSSTILDVTDYLFLPAEKEIFFSRSYSRTEEAKVLTQYQWYKPNNTAASSKKLRDGKAKYWWLRSPCSGYTNRVCVVSDSGSANFDLAHYDYGVAPFFSF